VLEERRVLFYNYSQGSFYQRSELFGFRNDMKTVQLIFFLIISIVFFVMAIGIFEFAYITQAQEVSVESLLVQIQELQKQVLELQDQLKKLEIEKLEKQIVFDQNLSVGMRTESVKNLQQVLTDEGIYTGPITGYFGSLTKAGVIVFQEKYADEILKPLGLAKGTGFFGPLTRKKLKALLTPIITFTVDGKKEITIPQGSPVTLAWDVKDADDTLSCIGTIEQGDGNWSTWRTEQPTSGSLNILAYNFPLEEDGKVIYGLSCSRENGRAGLSTVVIYVVAKSPNDMVVNLFANGEEIDDIFSPQISSLDLSWQVAGGAPPITCSISDNRDEVLAQDLSTTESFTISPLPRRQDYYVSCVDGYGFYVWDRVTVDR